MFQTCKKQETVGRQKGVNIKDEGVLKPKIVPSQTKQTGQGCSRGKLKLKIPEKGKTKYQTR